MPTLRRKLGDAGEGAAANYLKSYGYQILERNYRKKFGELDIVAKFRNNIVFIEVKSQKKGTRFLPAQNVNFFKQKRLVRAAQAYLKEKRIPPDAPWQIDVMVVEIDDETGTNKIEHLQNCVWGRC